jgi:hypothetical protein
MMMMIDTTYPELWGSRWSPLLMLVVVVVVEVRSQVKRRDIEFYLCLRLRAGRRLLSPSTVRGAVRVFRPHLPGHSQHAESTGPQVREQPNRSRSDTYHGHAVSTYHATRILTTSPAGPQRPLPSQSTPHFLTVYPGAPRNFPQHQLTTKNPREVLQASLSRPLHQRLDTNKMGIVVCLTQQIHIQQRSQARRHIRLTNRPRGLATSLCLVHSITLSTLSVDWENGTRAYFPTYLFPTKYRCFTPPKTRIS